MTQAEFVLLAQKLAGQLLDMRDTTSETTAKDAIENDEEPAYFLHGFIDRKDIKAVLAYQPPTEPEVGEDDEAYRTAATQQWHREGEIEIDSDAVVSKGDDPGAYVAAWVWVPDSALATTTTTEEKDN